MQAGRQSHHMQQSTACCSGALYETAQSCMGRNVLLVSGTEHMLLHRSSFALLFMWQHAIVGLAHYIVDCFEVLGALDDAPDDASTLSYQPWRLIMSPFHQYCVVWVGYMQEFAWNPASSCQPCKYALH